MALVVFSKRMKIYPNSETAPRYGPSVHTGNRSLNLGSNLDSLGQFEHRVVVLNYFPSRPQLSDTCY